MRLLLFAATILACWTAQGVQTWYVSTNGNDSWAGTEASPFLTIQKGVDTAIPGDRVIVGAGTYLESFSTVTNGTADARITIEGVGFPVANSCRVNHAYHTIKGIQFSGVTASLGALMFIDTTGTGLIVQSNRFWTSVTNSYYGIDAENGSIGTAPEDITVDGNDFLNTTFHAIDAQGTNWMIRGNRFESTNGWDAIRNGAFGWRVTQNVFTNWSNLATNGNHPDIIQAFLVLSGTNYIGGSAHGVFDRNLVVDCVGTQIGNVSDDGENGVLTDWEFRNNIFANDLAAINIAAPDFRWYNNLFYKVGVNTGGPLVFRILTIGGEGLYGDVRNNVFVECGSNPSSASQGWVGWDAGATNTLTQDYNLVIGTSAGTTKNSTFTLNGWNANSLNGVDPLLVNPASYNFRPQSGSPLIGAGVDLSASFTDDFDGNTRSGAWTIGPFQIASSQAGPSTLRISTGRLSVGRIE